MRKNNNPATHEQNRNRELVWMNYVPGVRESRRPDWGRTS